jgi:predicted deacylase
MRVELVLVASVVVFLIVVVASSRPNDNKIKVFKFCNGKPKFRLGIVASVHGNEPAGFRACTRLMSMDWFSKWKDIEVVVIPAGNPYGLRNGIRWSRYLLKPDINRNFGSESGDDPISKQILKAVKKCNMILDFHEGWGYYLEGKGSVGSTLMCTDTELAHTVAETAKRALNASIVNPIKKFTVIKDKQCDIKQTLRCYMNKKGIPYILTETSGQNNIQPMDLRMYQVITIIKSALLCIQFTNTVNTNSMS